MSPKYIVSFLLFVQMVAVSLATAKDLDVDGQQRAAGHATASIITPFNWAQNGHDVPQFVAELNNNGRITGLLDRAIIRAPWNILAAKLFKDISVFFIESYLVQLFGVPLPIP